MLLSAELREIITVHPYLEIAQAILLSSEILLNFLSESEVVHSLNAVKFFSNIRCFSFLVKAWIGK